jgi:hypothetical protein
MSRTHIFASQNAGQDYGVPAVMGKDPLSSAAIADGACRLIQQSDGVDFWHYSSRVQRVLQALADAPPTSNPSYFVLSAEDALRKACSDQGDVSSRPQYDLESLAGAVQNWYHALTAPSSDPSWKGQFDPAYQPQQVVYIHVHGHGKLFSSASLSFWVKY